MTADLADRLAAALGGSGTFWLNAQSASENCVLRSASAWLSCVISSDGKNGLHRTMGHFAEIFRVGIRHQSAFQAVDVHRHHVADYCGASFKT